MIKLLLGELVTDKGTIAPRTPMRSPDANMAGAAKLPSSGPARTNFVRGSCCVHASFSPSNLHANEHLRFGRT